MGHSSKRLPRNYDVNKNEELAEETETKKRSNNLIIHGKEEVEVNDDKLFVDNLIKELQISAIAIKQVERIGQKSDTSSTMKRPMKVILKNEEERDKVLSNLMNLKGKTLYKGISFTPDYTQNERLLIKEFHKKAKLKSTEEDYNNVNYI